MKHLTIMGMVMALMTIACSKVSPDFSMPSPLKSANVRLEAVLPDMEITEADSRATIAYTVRLNWHAGDAISVVNMSTGKTLAGNLISDVDGARTTFSGTLTGTVGKDDRLLFIYPSQNYSSESVIGTIDLTGHFAEQSGTNSSQIPFVAFAEGTLDDLKATAKPLDFVFQMSFFQVNVAGLPESQSIASASLNGFCNSVSYSYSSGELVPTYSEGAISLSPQVSTTGEGCRTMFFTCLPQSSSTRSMVVETAESRFAVAVPSSSIAQNTSYNLNLSGFSEVVE